MFNAELLAGKTALITGGGSGLGLAVAKAYLRHGANVTLVGRRTEVLEKAIAELDNNGRVLAVSGDVRFGDDAEMALDKTISQFGSLDILFNNAAANFVAPSEKLNAGAIRLIIDTVLMGTLNFTMVAGRHWIETGRPGTVLNTLTTYAQTGSGYVLPSSMAKAAVANMIYSLAAEWGKYRIRMLGIAPGPFPTDGATRQLRLDERLFEDKDTEEFVTGRIPCGRMGELEEFANLALYLASPGAEFLNGEIIRLDGGEIPYMSGEFNFLDRMSDGFWDTRLKQLNRRNG